MPLDTTVATTLHLGFAALWTGAVVFFTWTVLQRALSGDVDPGLFGGTAGRLVLLSRASALVTFVSGGHMAGRLYTADSLTGTGRGHLVLAMVALWLVLAALVEIGANRIRSGTDRSKVRGPARKARLPLYAANIAAGGLLVVAGLLASP